MSDWDDDSGWGYQEGLEIADRLKEERLSIANWVRANRHLTHIEIAASIEAGDYQTKRMSESE